MLCVRVRVLYVCVPVSTNHIHPDPLQAPLSARGLLLLLRQLLLALLLLIVLVVTLLRTVLATLLLSVAAGCSRRGRCVSVSEAERE